MGEPISVFLLDDHEVVRRGLRALLEPESDLVVVGEAATAEAGLTELLRLRPQVAVLDNRLPDGSGIEVGRALRDEAPEVRTLVLTSYDDDEALAAAYLAGAAGYVLKQIAGSSLTSAVRAVARGQSLVDPRLASRMLERIRDDQESARPLDALTPRQHRILELIGEGLTNRQIGERLFLAEKTVKNHVTSILAKLGVQRRTQAAVMMTRRRPQR